jgi:hypothetical protein
VKVEFVKGRKPTVVANADMLAVPRVGDEVALLSHEFLLFVRRVQWIETAAREGNVVRLRVFLSDRPPTRSTR